MKIGYVTADWSDVTDETGYPTFGGAGWYRCGLPAQYLKRNNIETVCVEKISIDRDGSIWLHDWQDVAHTDCDIVVFQRWMHESAPEIIRKAKASGQIIVNELDDWYWGLHKSNAAYWHSDPRRNPTVNRDHYWEALKASSYLTVSTPDLKERTAKLGVPTYVIRNCIDLERWEYKEPKDEKPNIGWVGSTSHRSGDLETLNGMLGPFCDKHELMFIHAGYLRGLKWAGDLAGVPKYLQDFEPLTIINNYPNLFKRIDIGLAPLNDIAFNHSKSCIKAMEYAAAGVPFVATKINEYEWLRREHSIGMTAKNPKDWENRLTKLLDFDFRKEEAERNRRNIKAFDFADRYVDWLKVYENML